jgi:hypothetical protein
VVLDELHLTAAPNATTIGLDMAKTEVLNPALRGLSDVMPNKDSLSPKVLPLKDTRHIVELSWLVMPNVQSSGTRG